MEEINQNFLSSILEGRLFLIFGICSSFFAFYILFKKKRPFLKGIANVFLVLGLLQTVIGSTVLVKSGGNKIEQEIELKINNQKYISSEIQKNETLLQNLKFYRWTGISFFIVGLLVFFNFDKTTSWRGIGLGFIIQSILLQVINYLATSRVKELLLFLKSLVEY